jgi:Protein of unknown function (DUF2848)
MPELTLNLGGHAVVTDVRTVIVAGWTGRDRCAVEEHIAELEALGVPRPSSAPLFYRVSAARVTTAPEIESTTASSGEVEPVLLHHDGRLWVGVGSDHTDREVESYGVAVAKQLCDKPMAEELWPYEEVEAHWDRLILRSWIIENGAEVPYQEGTLDGLLAPRDLLTRAEPKLADGTLMFCGTFPAQGGIRPARAFRYELTDPERGRSITGGYAMRELPLVS